MLRTAPLTLTTRLSFAAWLAVAALLAGCAASGPRMPARITPYPFTTSTPPATDAPPPDSDATPTEAAVAAPSPTPAGTPFVLGTSAGGREIEGWRLGEGPRKLVIVGGLHGGWEGNSSELADLLLAHYRLNPDAVLPGVELIIIPAANPDGLAAGSDLDARYNGNGVDLNRNWGCEWSETAYLQDNPIDPGPEPFSEPETQALRDFFLAEQPDAVVFYHSFLAKVFVGDCGDGAPPGLWLGDLLAQATGYTFEHDFSYYEVTGDATNWLATHGIPAAVVELATQTDPEFSRNLPAVQAIQCRFAREGLADLTAEQRQAVGEACP